MNPNCTATAIHSEDASNIEAEMRITVRLGKRSATTPPMGTVSTPVTPNAMVTKPRLALLPVRSNASDPRAII
jgi:hypothetical protein